MMFLFFRRPGRTEPCRANGTAFARATINLRVVLGKHSPLGIATPKSHAEMPRAHPDTVRAERGRSASAAPPPAEGAATSTQFGRSAPVLGRSNVRTPARFKFLLCHGGFQCSCARDGHTPAQQFQDAPKCPWDCFQVSFSPSTGCSPHCFWAPVHRCLCSCLSLDSAADETPA